MWEHISKRIYSRSSYWRVLDLIRDHLVGGQAMTTPPRLERCSTRPITSPTTLHCGSCWGPDECERTVCPVSVARERLAGYREGRAEGYAILEAYVTDLHSTVLPALAPLSQGGRGDVMI